MKIHPCLCHVTPMEHYMQQDLLTFPPRVNLLLIAKDLLHAATSRTRLPTGVWLVLSAYRVML